MKNDNLIYIKMYNHERGNIVIEPLEKVVKMFLINQCPIEFNIEALKTNAIIARTNIIREMKMFGGNGSKFHDGCDICDGEHCIGINRLENLYDMWENEYEKNLEKINQAIKETEGMIITVNNKPIYAYYNETCGGSTENSENVIGRRVSYLRRVLCDYCTDSPGWEDEVELSIEDIGDNLNVRFPRNSYDLNINMTNYIDDINRDDLGRIISMKIGDKEFKAREILEKLKLNSTKFSITPIKFKVRTRGKGKGLGLCQWGANDMANKGMKYDEIIKYYYTGIEIKKVEKPCINKPLKDKILILDPGHGGNISQDVIGKKGSREKDIVLYIAKLLKENLEQMGAKVTLTREEDKSVSLSERVNLANKIRPDFFISLHLNSFHNSSIHGCEIYHYKNDRDSVDLSKSIMDSLEKTTDIINRGIKTADFFVLREVGVSSLHIEIEYLTNPEVEEKLMDNMYLKKISQGLSEGISEYYIY